MNRPYTELMPHDLLSTDPLPIPAFGFAGEQTLYDAVTGDILPADYSGHCLMYSPETARDDKHFRPGGQLFLTWLEFGERNWQTDPLMQGQPWRFGPAS